MKLFDAVRVTLLFVILTSSLTTKPASAEAPSKVRVSVIINASTKSVWDAIRSPDMPIDHRRVLSVGDRQAVIEETFDDLPFLRSSTCIIKEVETPFKRIDYVMVKSDKLKALEGCWIITPLQDGRTTVELESTLDCGIHIPFARKIGDDVALKICKQRLAIVKETAETTQQRVVSKLD